MKCPCTRECARRAVGCRSGCNEYQIYAAEKAEEYALRARINELGFETDAHRRARVRMDREAKRGRRRRK